MNESRQTTGPSIGPDLRSARLASLLIPVAAAVLLANAIKIGVTRGLGAGVVSTIIVLAGGMLAYWRLQTAVQTIKGASLLATALALFWLIGVALYLSGIPR